MCVCVCVCVCMCVYTCVYMCVYVCRFVSSVPVFSISLCSVCEECILHKEFINLIYVLQCANE